MPPLNKLPTKSNINNHARKKSLVSLLPSNPFFYDHRIPFSGFIYLISAKRKKVKDKKMKRQTKTNQVVQHIRNIFLSKERLFYSIIYLRITLKYHKINLSYIYNFQFSLKIYIPKYSLVFATLTMKAPSKLKLKTLPK